jgi:cytochrome c oxidase cbb3-type subunit 3
MFSFFRRYAETIAGVNVYPKISLIIFFVFFVALLWFTFRVDKKFIQEQANIPLD